MEVSWPEQLKQPYTKDRAISGLSRWKSHKSLPKRKKKKREATFGFGAEKPVGSALAG